MSKEKSPHRQRYYASKVREIRDIISSRIDEIGGYIIIEHGSHPDLKIIMLGRCTEYQIAEP